MFLYIIDGYLKDMLNKCNYIQDIPSLFIYNATCVISDLSAKKNFILFSGDAQIAALHKQGEKLGLSPEAMAFYDALTKPEAIKNFYENDQLVAMTRELHL